MFRFTIRDVLLVMVIVGLAVGWWIDRRRLDAPLAKLTEYERLEQVALQRKQDEKRLQDLRWKLSSVQSVRNGAPWPAGEQPKFTSAEYDEMIRLELRLAQDEPATTPGRP